MSSSTSSFKGYTIVVLLILIVTVALPTTALLAASEWLIRTHIIPNARFMWQMDKMLSSQNENVVFGDSHTMYGVHGLSGFLNLSSPDTVPGIEAKVWDYFADKQPGQVILQADPYLVSPRLVKREPIYKSCYRKSPTHLWVLTRLYRPKVKAYWELYFQGHDFTNTYTFQPDGAITRTGKWGDVPEDTRIAEAGQFVIRITPDQVPKENKGGRSYQRILEFLTSKGADVCMVRMPWPSEVLSQITSSKDAEKFQRAQLYFQSQAATYGATYVDMSSAIADGSLFSDRSHLNVAGVLELALTLQTACFGSSQDN